MQDNNLIEKPSCEHEGNTHWIGENAKLSKRTAFGKWTECPFCKTQSPYSIQFVPFGDEWKAMMMRWAKKNLVNLLSSKLKELQLERSLRKEMRETLEKIACPDFHKEKDFCGRKECKIVQTFFEGLEKKGDL